MFYTVISRDTFNQIMSIFFRNLGLVSPEAELEIKLLEFDGDAVIVEADLQQETIQ